MQAPLAGEFPRGNIVSGREILICFDKLYVFDSTRKCLEGTRFKSDELQRINDLIRHVAALSHDEKCDVALVVDNDDKIVTSGVCQGNNHPLRHCSVIAVNRVAITQASGTTSANSREIPYLCTDNDVYVTREPCLMCSMALLHSRIKRLFFIESFKNSGRGCPDDGSFTRMRLHVSPKLNHRFEVWKVKTESVGGNS